MTYETQALKALVCACLSCATGTFSTQILASVIDSREIALVMESTLVDLDTSMIAIHHGLSPESQLNYISRVADSGWQGRLFGAYGGHEVDIYYTGSVVFIGGADSRFDIIYASDWFIDGESGAGSGSAVYTDPPFSFSIDLVNAQVSGSISVTYGITTLALTGSKDFGEHTLSVRGSASVVDLGPFGSLADAGLSLEYNQLTGAYASVLDANYIGGLFSSSSTINRGTIRRLPPGQDQPPPPRRGQNPPNLPFPLGALNGGFIATDPGFNNMTVATVPEPGSHCLVALGLFAALFSRAKLNRSALGR